MAVESRERRLQIKCSTNFHNCYRYRVDQTDINSNLVCRGVPMLVLHQRNFTTSTVSCALERCWILQVFGVCSGLHRCACQPPKVQRSVWSHTREALCPMHPYEQLPLEFTCPHFTLTLWLCFTHFIYFTDILLGCCWFANVFQEISLICTPLQERYHRLQRELRHLGEVAELEDLKTQAGITNHIHGIFMALMAL